MVPFSRPSAALSPVSLRVSVQPTCGAPKYLPLHSLGALTRVGGLLAGICFEIAEEPWTCSASAYVSEVSRAFAHTFCRACLRRYLLSRATSYGPFMPKCPSCIYRLSPQEQAWALPPGALQEALSARDAELANRLASVRNGVEVRRQWTQPGATVYHSSATTG